MIYEGGNMYGTSTTTTGYLYFRSKGGSHISNVKIVKNMLTHSRSKSEQFGKSNPVKINWENS